MRTLRSLALVTLAVVAVACRSDGRTLRPPVFAPPPTTSTTLPAEEVAPAPLRLIAPWPDGGTIPNRHTCDGADVAPALSWTDVPPGTVELALTLTDTSGDAEVLWILYGVEPGNTGLVEGEVPAGAYHWPNSAGLAGWQGPCPPPGSERLFQFTLRALNQQLEVADDASADEVLAALAATSIAQSSVSGTYTRDP